MSLEYSPPPSGVGIDLVEASSERLVISIPPGGKKARGIGCFGFVWLAITVPISVVILSVPEADWEGGEAPPLIFLIPFFGIFYAVGLGMVYAWVRMTFTQVFLAITPEQFAIQRTLFGRKKLKKIQLDENSCAELVESYRENDSPVYAVHVQGTGDKSKFATRLSYEEKRWIAAAINQFLGRDSEDAISAGTSELPENCPRCGTKLMIGDGRRICPDCEQVFLDSGDVAWKDEDGVEVPVTRRSKRFSDAVDPRGRHSKITERPPAVAPFELPDDSSIRIDQDDGQVLEFSYPINLPKFIKILVGGFLTFFCFSWYGGVFTFIGMALAGDEPIGIKIGITLFASMFLFAGMMPLGILLSLFFGRVKINIDADYLQASAGFLFLRKKKRISTESISDVGLGSATMTSSRRHRGVHRTAEIPLGSTGLGGSMLKSTETDMPLSMSSDQQLNRQVAGLVRYQLERLGVPLHND